MLRVLHLVGSAVSDFYCDLSRLYAEDCLQSTADETLYDFRIAYVTPDRRWRFPVDLTQGAIAAADPMPVGRAVGHLLALEIDVMVPQMFCVPGMTYYRGLFDVLGIPYLGNTSDVMALTAHKGRAKAVVAAAGVPVPAGELLRAGQQPLTAPPAVVKPADADNSLGIALVRDRAGYTRALGAAFEHSDEVLVERYIELGREVRCGIIAGNDGLVCLPLEEYSVDRERKPIRGYDDKISKLADGELNLVAKDVSKAWIVDRDDPITRRVWDAALSCHEALGCRHYSLFDFRIDPEGQPWFLEAGLYCSFARKSVIPMMASASGISLEALFHSGLQQALAFPAATRPR